MILLVALPAAADCRLSAGMGMGWRWYPDEPSVALESSCDVWRDNIELAAGYIGPWSGDDRGDIDGYGYASAAWVVRFHMKHVDPFITAGLMARSTGDGNVDELLPSWWNFSLSAGLDWGKVRVQYRHFSNANLKEPNRGQNLLTIGYRFGGRL